MNAVQQCIEVRAQEVAAWLEARFGWREVWVSSELHLAANQAGIDLGTWWHHPELARLGIVRERADIPGMPDVWVFHRNLDEPVLLEPSRDPAAAFVLGGLGEMGATAIPNPVVLTDEERARIIAVCEEGPALTCDVIDPEVAVS